MSYITLVVGDLVVIKGKGAHKRMWKVDWIDIELTSFCNIHCEGCFRELSDYADKVNNKEMISLETIREKFRKYCIPWDLYDLPSTFFGGKCRKS